MINEPYPWFLSKRAIYAAIAFILPMVIIFTMANLATRHPDWVAGCGLLGLLGGGTALILGIINLREDS